MTRTTMVRLRWAFGRALQWITQGILVLGLVWTLMVIATSMINRQERELPQARFITSTGLIDWSKIDREPIRKASTAELNCLAENIYYEAGAEPELGKIAVGIVTINRTRDHRWPGSICAVVSQRTPVATTSDSRWICQFSWMCESTHTTRKKNQQNWASSQRVARMLLEHGGYERYSAAFEGIKYFHNTSVRTNWGYRKVAQIGNHIFYK